MTPGEVDYRERSRKYAAHRCTEPRIAAAIQSALGDATSIVNVGAGTGSYEPTDRSLVPVEPSAAMRSARPPHLPIAVDARAEDLPFATRSFDAAMAIMTIHQWTDLDRGLRELQRVSRGPVVILTFDPDALAAFWLADYEPALVASERRRFPSIAEVRRVLGQEVRVLPVPIPIDCADGFLEAYYGRPEAFLDPGLRAAQSAWSLIDPQLAEQGLARLRSDLDQGEWDRRYGHLRTQPEFDGALRLVVGGR